MPTTLKDIAEHLELSQALVSRVLNDRPGVWASQETRRRIVEAAAEMNYRPSISARALATGKTMQIAVSSADADWHKGSSGRMLEVRGLIDAAALHEYRVLVLPSPRHHADSAQFAEIIRTRACDGFCLYAEQANAALYQFLRDNSMPFVVVGHAAGADVPRVDQDNAGQMRESVQWLSAQGHKRIALASPSTDTPPHRDVMRDSFMDTMHECGHPVRPGEDGPALIAHDEMAAWLAAHGDITAIIVQGLPSALNWKWLLHASGRRVPEDVAVLTHIDSSEWLHLSHGDLKNGLAVHIYDSHRVGEVAGEILIQWINGEAPSIQDCLIRGLGPCWSEEVDIPRQRSESQPADSLVISNTLQEAL